MLTARRSSGASFARDQHHRAVELLGAAQRSRLTARECARGAAAAAVVSIASAIANAAGGVAIALALIAGLLARRGWWVFRARSQRSAGLSAEMMASVAASDWETRTKWGLRRAKGDLRKSA